MKKSLITLLCALFVFSAFFCVNVLPLFVADLINLSRTFTLSDIDVALTLRNTIEVSAVTFLVTVVSSMLVIVPLRLGDIRKNGI